MKESKQAVPITAMVNTDGAPESIMTACGKMAKNMEKQNGKELAVMFMKENMPITPKMDMVSTNGKQVEAYMMVIG